MWVNEWMNEWINKWMNEWIVVKSHPDARWYDAHALLSDIPVTQYCFFFM